MACSPQQKNWSLRAREKPLTHKLTISQGWCGDDDPVWLNGAGVSRVQSRDGFIDRLHQHDIVCKANASPCGRRSKTAVRQAAPFHSFRSTGRCCGDDDDDMK